LLTAGTTAPTGTLLANGQLLSVSGNTALFGLLGTAYGGNGTTTFAVPDLRKSAPDGLSYSICATAGIFP
jgi:microcystin-dependent protein